MSLSTLIASTNPFLTLNIDEIPPITIAPTPTYLIFEDHISHAPSIGLDAKFSPFPKIGIPNNQLREPPINIKIETLRLTIKPTATKAGDISPPKNSILFPFTKATSKTPLSSPT